MVSDAERCKAEAARITVKNGIESNLRNLLKDEKLANKFNPVDKSKARSSSTGRSPRHLTFSLNDAIFLWF